MYYSSSGLLSQNESLYFIGIKSLNVGFSPLGFSRVNTCVKCDGFLICSTTFYWLKFSIFYIIISAVIYNNNLIPIIKIIDNRNQIRYREINMVTWYKSLNSEKRKLYLARVYWKKKEERRFIKIVLKICNFSITYIIFNLN